MKVGDLFLRPYIHTTPCVHCNAPAVALDRGAMHFAIEGGAKTAWPDCYEIVRGRRKYTGTTAALP